MKTTPCTETSENVRNELSYYNQQVLEDLDLGNKRFLKNNFAGFRTQGFPVLPLPNYDSIGLITHQVM
jgi:hypothetical protein